MKNFVVSSVILSLSAGLLIAGKADKKLDIYWIDSEGGGSTLIVTPNDESVLIDTGNPGGRDSQRIYDVASGVAKLKQIDHMLITHFHIDHFGGAAELAEKMPIRHIYDKGVPEKLSEDAQFPSRIKGYKAIKAENRVTLLPGWEVHLNQPQTQLPGGLRLTCLAANQEMIKTRNAENPLCAGKKEKEKDATDNANSIVMLLRFGKFRFFDGGDLTWNIEGNLVCPTNRVGTVDVYQSNHHGLDQSNSPILVGSLAPTLVVYNNGPRKGCEPESMATMRKVSSIKAIYQVHKNLQAGSANAPDDCIANVEESCKANYIKLSVEPSGDSYTITIPSTGKTQTFKVQDRLKK